MKTHKFIFNCFPKIITFAVMTCFSLASPALSTEDKPEKIQFLQDIQNQLLLASGIKNRAINILITTDKKRKVILTPSSISLSYGFLKKLNSINQLVATMAHMTAHISLNYVATPPLPEKDHEEKTSLKDYINEYIQPKYPDKSYIPQATGSFHNNHQRSIIERPRYQNKDYDYSVNKADIIEAEHEREVDKITDKIMRHANFCPSDYSRLLNYFYENPQQMLGNKHFALDADQWQRIDTIDRRANPSTICADEKLAQTRKYAPAFDQLKVKILHALRKKTAEE